MAVRIIVRKTFALLMSLVLVVGLMPCIAFAEDSYPDSNVPVSATGTSVDVGNVQVVVDNYSECLVADAHAREGQDATLNVHGNIDATGNERRGVDGVRAYSSDKTASATIDGNVTVDVNRDTTPATNNVSTVGVVALARPATEELSATANIVVKGDVKASTTTNYDVDVYGVNNQATGVYPQNSSIPVTTSVSIGGDVSAELVDGAGMVYGVYSFAYYASKAITDVAGGVSATGNNGYAKGVNVVAASSDPGGSQVSVSVGKDGVSVIGGSSATGLYVMNSNGIASISVAGDVSSVAKKENGTSSGIMIEGVGGSTDIFVDGTVASKSFGVRNDSKDGQCNVTVWKIVSDHVAGKISGKEAVDDEATEKAIKYIIKVEQPKEGAKLSALKADGTSLEQSHNLGVAYWGDKVLLKVDLEPGYRIKAAYNGLDGSKVQIVAGSDGNYYVVVPNGGGVYLSIDVEKVEKPSDNNGTHATSAYSAANTMPKVGDGLDPLAVTLCTMMLFALAIALAGGLLARRKELLNGAMRSCKERAGRFPR